MTREEFIKGYCERSKMAWDELSLHLDALPCDCGEDNCKGWAMVPRDPLSVATHLQLYSPDTELG